MAKSKNHHYVLVLTNEGAKFVTATMAHHTAEWDKFGTPKEFTSEWATEIANGLMLNGTVAYHIVSQIEFTTQPYYYEKGHFEWVWNTSSDIDKPTD